LPFWIQQLSLGDVDTHYLLLFAVLIAAGIRGSRPRAVRAHAAARARQTYPADQFRLQVCDQGAVSETV
jgi:hypothetical protein